MAGKGIFAKKSITDLQKEAGAESSLKRSLSATQLVLLGIGCIIGAGIFVLTGTAAATHAGPAIVLSFVVAGIACGFAGLCYAELASVIPVSGSAYTYSYATLGEFVAWIIGWHLVLEYAFGAATVAAGWSGYVSSFLRDFGIIIPAEFASHYGAKITLADGTIATGIFNVPAFLAILAVTAFLVVGISESAKLNAMMVFVKISVVIAFILFGFSHIDAANWDPFIPENTSGNWGEFGYTGILAGAATVFFAYIGFDAVSTAAQEAKNPQRDMPIGILGSLVICTLLYILVAGVLTGVVHYSKLNVPDPMAIAIDSIGIGWLSTFIKIGAITGLSSVMLVLCYGQTRVFYAMSKDGLLPAIFSKIHPKFHTPHISTILFGFIIATLAALFPIKNLGEMVSMGTLLAFTMVCAGTIYLRYTQPDLHRPFKCPLVPIVPGLGMLFCIGLMYSLSDHTFTFVGAWFVAGVVLYFAYGMKRSKLRNATN